MREAIASGKTVEEATEKACAQLGKSRDEVSVEILEMPIKKLFKSVPAKVKVTLEEEETSILEEPKAEKPIETVAASQPIAPQAVPAQRREEVQAERPASKAPEHKEVVLEKEPEVEIDLGENQAAKKAVDYLMGIFNAMGAGNVKIVAYRQGDATLLRVEGEELADKLETRGETIQALSYLTDRTVNRGVDKKEENYLRVRLDIAGYRNRRERELISLAERTGREVAKTGRSRTLAPMNPYERLIIHTRISEMEGVASESTGSDTERRVVIRSTAPNAKDGGDDYRSGRSGQGGRGGRQGGGGNRGGRGGRSGGGPRSGEKREQRDSYHDRPASNTPEREYASKQRDENAAPVVPQRREAIQDVDDLPLYGKIEI